MEQSKLDRNTKPRNKVQVRITLKDAKTYKLHADDFKALADRAGGSMAVKMSCD